MKAPNPILNVWKLFDGYPMETLTKAWLYETDRGRRQRTVSEMVDDRLQYGTSGNCFDLAIWLLHAFEAAGIDAYAIGHDLLTPNAHVAVIAVDNGYRYLCDLGDQWIAPILIDSASADFTPQPISGFVTGGRVQVETDCGQTAVIYHRPGGKTSKQLYDLSRIEDDLLMRAGTASQSLLRHPLCEMRVLVSGEVAHWEFDSWRSFLGTDTGLADEFPAGSNERWSLRIRDRTGIHLDVTRKALDIYEKYTSSKEVE